MSDGQLCCMLAGRVVKQQLLVKDKWKQMWQDSPCRNVTMLVTRCDATTSRRRCSRGSAPRYYRHDNASSTTSGRITNRLALPSRYEPDESRNAPPETDRHCFSRTLRTNIASNRHAATLRPNNDDLATTLPTPTPPMIFDGSHPLGTIPRRCTAYGLKWHSRVLHTAVTTARRRCTVLCDKEWRRPRS